MDRSRFGYGERVNADTTKPGTNEDKFNLAFDRVEASANERQLDHHPPGIKSGLEVVENATPNMTVKVNAGVAYDQLGQRIEVPSQQSVDPLTDYQGNAIALPAGGQEKYVSLFLKFAVLKQNATQDENSVPYHQDELEHFEIRVRGGAAAAADSATPPALQGSEILLADILLTPGMVEIGTGDIELLDRRQDAYKLSPTNAFPKQIRRGKIKDVVTDLLQFINEILDGTQAIASSSLTHANGVETFAGGNAPPASGFLQAWLRSLVTMLGKTTATPGLALIGNVALGNWADGNSAGAAGGASTQLAGIVSALAAAAGLAKVGGAAKSGTPDSLTAGTGQNIVEQLLTLVNARARKAAAETITAKYTFDLASAGVGLETAADTTADLNGPVQVDDITATGTNKYKYTSRSITRVQTGKLRNTVTGSFGSGGASVSIGVGEDGIQALKLPHDSTLEAVTFYHNRAGSGTLPDTKVSGEVVRVNIVTGVTATVGSVTDPSANSAAYDPHHGFALALSESVDTTTCRYYARLTGESGSNSSATTWFGVSTTVAVSNQDEAQG